MTDRSVTDRLAEALWRSHILMSVGIAAATLREWSEVLPDTQDDWRFKAEQVMVEGKIKTRKWEKDGVERYSTEIVIESFGGALELLGSKNDNGGDDDRGARRAPKASAAQTRGGSVGDDPDDEIPFLYEWR